MGHSAKRRSTTTKASSATATKEAASQSPEDALLEPGDSPLEFIRAFARAPLSVGSLWPSSPKLAKRVADSCDFGPEATVVELGAGTGAFTGLLLNRLQGNGRLLAVEIDPKQAALLRRRYPRCQVIEDSAARLGQHLHGRKADCVVSGLAWVTMLPPTQHAIFRAVLKSLKSGGQFVAFAYVHAAWFPTSLRFRHRLLRHFDRVETTSIVWHNMPPAFVFRCWRA